MNTDEYKCGAVRWLTDLTDFTEIQCELGGLLIYSLVRREIVGFVFQFNFISRSFIEGSQRYTEEYKHYYDCYLLRETRFLLLYFSV